jgi:acyl-CoA thioesterase-2
VLGQALSAAHKTVDGRTAHSLHAYFLRRGDMKAPIIYEVDRARDGAASFQKPEDGLEHQAAMPEVPPPEGLQDVTEVDPDVLVKIPEKMRRFLTDKRPFEFRPVRPINFTAPEKLPPEKQVWIRAVDRLPDDPPLHQNLLAYVSDYELLGTSTLPHGLTFGRGRVQMASLDHALWFHREARIDDWLLYAFDSPNASGARGYARGQFFTREGGPQQAQAVGPAPAGMRSGTDPGD